VYDAAVGTYVFCVDDASCATPGGSASCSPGQFSSRQVTEADMVAVYSNTAPFLDILAPSHDAYTTDISGSDGYSGGDYFPDFGGTSASAPYAAGVVACLQSAVKAKTGSYLSPSEIKSILVSTGDGITDDKVAITKPRINVGRAVDGTTIEEEFSSTDVPIAIPDAGTVTSTLEITEAGTIIDLDVKLDITHTKDRDLDVYLIAPDGTRVELFTDVGGLGDNFSNTILDDEASVAITDGSAPFDGSYQPEGILGDFDSNSVTGIWTLEVKDDLATNSGTLNSWSLIIKILVDGEPNAPVLHFEPEITAGLCNMISWDSVPEAGVYYAEFASDPCFAVVEDSSGWIPGTDYEFCGLVSGQEYWYRVKSAYYALEGAQSAWSNIESSRQCGTPGDFEPDCDVDWADLAVLIEQWLQVPGTPSADIAPQPDGDGIVDFYDFAELATHWLIGSE
jgi:subtilisin-like proprotein convertase family protein